MALGSYNPRQTFGGGARYGFGPDGQWQQLPDPPPSYTAENALPRAIEQQGGDYDQIMAGYRNQLNTNDPDYGDLMGRYRQMLTAGQQGPTRATYAETPEFREAFGSARELANTGGINAQEEAAMRSRGVSPIRAAYQNAQRNMQTQARLGGGSANYNAAISRMARQQGQSMADAMENVNAGIAETRQRGRIAGTGNMTTMGEGSSGRRTQVEIANANNANQHMASMAGLLGGMGNLMNMNQNRRLQSLQGMTSLYGTTPALVNTFGNQVANNTQLMQNAARNTPRRSGGAGVASIGGGGYYGGGIGG